LPSAAAKRAGAEVASGAGAAANRVGLLAPDLEDVVEQSIRCGLQRRSSEHARNSARVGLVGEIDAVGARPVP
jgi:hypothetical protein